MLALSLFKEKEMPLSKYIEIVRPKYITLQILPNTSVRNYNSANIARMISTMHQSISKCISREERKYFIKTPVKCSYMIDIYKDDVRFYFIVPEQYESIAKNRIISTWERVTVKVINNIPTFNDDSISAYQLKYSKIDSFSLDINTKSNYPLNNILDVIDVMEKGDRVSILYNFQPCTQYGWSVKCDKAHEKFKNGMPISKGMDTKYAFWTMLYIIVDFLDKVINNLSNNKIEDINPISELSSVLKDNNGKLSDLTKKKKHETILNAQIAIISTSSNAVRSQSNAISVCQSFHNTKGDNELIYEKVKVKNLNMNDYSLGGIDKNKVSVSECQNFIQMPGRDLLLEHKINHVNTLESEVPEALRKGVMCLGESIKQGVSQKAYLSNDFAFQYLTLCIIGSTRAGKSTLISNFCNDSLIAGETNIIFDWCGNGKLSNDVIDSLKGTGIKVLDIDCSDTSKLQGLGYNELYVDNDDQFELYRSAKQQATQLMTLINATQSGDEDLRARMERYLGAATLVVAIQKGSIRDIFMVLQNHKVRNEYIRNIPSSQKENMSEYVEYLKELDEIGKDGEVKGTRLTSVQGILNRINKLKENAYIENMLKIDCKNNFNLVEEIQKRQLICIKMPEKMFLTEQEKDTYATYWLTKIWGALQQRLWQYDGKEEDMVKVNLYFDELYQVNSCQEFLRSKLSQIAKFKAKPIISCHYLGQIGNIRNELKSANTSYIMISGSDKDNYKELKSELEPYGVEDLLNLKRFHALNLIRYEDGWGKFITKMPKPLR